MLSIYIINYSNFRILSLIYCYLNRVSYLDLLPLYLFQSGMHTKVHSRRIPRPKIYKYVLVGLIMVLKKLNLVNISTSIKYITFYEKRSCYDCLLVSRS